MRQETNPTPQTTAIRDVDALLDDKQIGAELGVSIQTLRNWRWKGIGPRWHRIGARMVRYKRSDVDAFINGNGDADGSQHER